MSDPCVYFIQADENGPIKIGFTADDPKRRLSQLQTGNPSMLKLLGSVKGSSAHEKRFHATLAEWRLQGEWFQSHPTVLAAIEHALASSSTQASHEGGTCLRCSFCFRCHHELETILIAGPAANICEECIEWAAEAVASQKAASC